MTRPADLAGGVLAVDPGKRAIGLAYFSRSGELIKAGLIRPKGANLEDLVTVAGTLAQAWTPSSVSLGLCERMSTRGGKAVNPQDLIDLSIVSWFALGAVRPAVSMPVDPSRWKGNTPKAIHGERIWKCLGEVEAARLEEGTFGEPAGLIHNAVDAVGLGLWYFGRLVK